MNQGHTAPEGEKAIVAILDGLKSKPMGATELEKAKNQEIAGFILGRDTDNEKAVALEEATILGKDPNLVNTELARYLAVTPEGIEATAKKYFVSEQATVLFVTPQAGPPPSASAQKEKP
jgi:zinc protease